MSVLKINGKKRERDKLDSSARKLLHAMWNGVDHDLTMDNGEIIQAGTPLGDYVASKAIGLPRRVLEFWRHQRVFKDASREQMIARRNEEEPNNLVRLIEIRNDKSDPRTLGAIDRIRVKDPTPAVHVDLSRHDNRQQTLVAPAGYVVNLGEPIKVEEKE